MKTTIKMVSSKNPMKDLAAVTYVGQDPTQRMYRPNYESYFDEMPILEDNDAQLKKKVKTSHDIMVSLAEKLKQDDWMKHIPVGERQFKRTIIAMEAPIYDETGCCIKKEGAEFVVAHWGDHFASPVHGHAPGYLHEEILEGKLRINTYRMVRPDSRVVRPVETFIASKGTFASMYNAADSKNVFKRQALIHNFVSIGKSTSLHYVPEHTRDGRDNSFVVEHFEASYNLDKKVTRLTAQEGLHQPIGTVILVRSSNVPEYGDHFIIITGSSIMKEHGLRPQDKAIQTSSTFTALNKYKPEMGLVLLKLNEEAKQAFLEFHDIKVENDVITFPNA